MRVGKRSICGIMAGILFMMEPVSGYGMMREGTWKKDIRNQIMEIQQMQPELTPYTGPEITAPSAILMEASTGTVICEKNADEPRNPASVTKIMTLILIFDALQSGKIRLTDEVVTSAHAKSMGGSQVFLEEGEIQTVETLIKCIVIASGNDASVAMAEFIGGDEGTFVKMMNERAKGLGMEHTHGFPGTCDYGEGHRADVQGTYHKIPADHKLYDDLDGEYHPCDEAGDKGVRSLQHK